MQSSGSFSGAIGPFQDPVSGQAVSGTAEVQYTVQSTQPVDFATLLPQVNNALHYALNKILTEKLAANQVALPTLQASLPYYQQEIAACSNISQAGLELTHLQARLSIRMPEPAIAPYAGPLPPSPAESMRNAFAQQAKDRLDPRNYELKTSAKVGGLKIKASSKKGIDTEGLKNQVVDKAKSTIIWWIGGCLILFLVFLFLAGIGGYVWWIVAQSH